MVKWYNIVFDQKVGFNHYDTVDVIELIASKLDCIEIHFDWHNTHCKTTSILAAEEYIREHMSCIDKITIIATDGTMEIVNDCVQVVNGNIKISDIFRSINYIYGISDELCELEKVFTNDDEFLKAGCKVLAHGEKCIFLRTSDELFHLTPEELFERFPLNDYYDVYIKSYYKECPAYVGIDADRNKVVFTNNRARDIELCKLIIKEYSETPV